MNISPDITPEEAYQKALETPELQIDTVKIVPRCDWGAVGPRPSRELTLPVDTVLSTYTGTETCSTDDECMTILRGLQTVQMEEKGMPDIQWNFMIGGNGTIYEGRGFKTVATKLPHYSQAHLNSLDIGYIGQRKEVDLTMTMFAAFNGLLSVAMEEDHLVENFKYIEETASRDIYEPFILQQ